MRSTPNPETRPVLMLHALLHSLAAWRHAWRLMSRDKADTLLLLAACALVLAPHAGHITLWIALVSMTLFGWRVWITLRGTRLPPRWVLVPIALLTLPGVYWTYDTFFGRDAGVAILVLLLTCKLLEMRARRDLFVVVYLSFFLMLTNLFYSQSIGTALLMLLTTLIILTTQLSFQFTGLMPSLFRRLQLTALIMGLATPLMLVLFFLFPRVEGPLWGSAAELQSTHTGVAETMTPNNLATLAISEDIAFRVRFIDPMPAYDALYWRGLVLGNYDGHSWSKLQSQNQGQTTTVIRKGAPVHYQITMEPSNQRWLYALDVPQQLPDAGAMPATIGIGMQLTTLHPISERIRYSMASVITYSLQPDEETLALQDWLDLPPGFNPRTHAYAARLRHQSDDNATLVQTVLTMFRTEPFRYTLTPPAVGRDAVDAFLFDTRAGFCEHFASAFVVLMRALDIPARVVVGYQGGQRNPIDQFLTVRQSDAHAWAEVWLAGRGWVRIDPTAAVAPERISRDATLVSAATSFAGLMRLDLRGNPLRTAVRMRMDAMNNAWHQWVLNYSFRRQQSLLQWFGFHPVGWGTLAALMTGLGSAALLIAVLPLLWQRTRADPCEVLYQRFCARMAARGVVRARHEGPRAYTLRLTADNSLLTPEKQQHARHFLALYEALRYGGSSDMSTRRQQLHQLSSLLVKLP